MKNYATGDRNYFGKRDFCSKGHEYTDGNVYYAPRNHAENTKGTGKARNCKKCRSEYQRKYRLANLEKFSKKEVIRSRRKKEQAKAKLFAALGKECSCCGETREAFLTLDHIGGGGKKHREQVKQDRMYITVVREGCPKDKYRILCMNCNWATRFNQPCPHEWERINSSANLDVIEEFVNG